MDTSEPQVCPFLGISGDPSSHFSFPEGSHRCHAQSREQGIDLAYQSSVCMSGGYQRCSRYERAVVPARATTRASSAPRQSRAARSSRARSWRRVLGRVAAITVLAVLVVALVAVGRALLDGPRGGLAGPGPPLTVVGSPTPSPTAVAATPTDTAPPTAPPDTPPPTATPSPSPTSAPPATPRPTATPTPEATPVIHVVRPGDTLTSIARLYGVTKRSIVEANELADPNHIRIDQRLLIPVGEQ